MQNNKSFRFRRRSHVLFKRKPTKTFTAYSWSSTHWVEIESKVSKLRTQIFLAKLHGNDIRLRTLQAKALNSKCNLLWSIRRVTSINRGKNTAGIDKLVYLTPERRWNLFLQLSKVDLSTWVPQPVRRIEIPKPGRTEKRPLGIPNIRDRVVQAVVKNALEPEWEAQFEHGSYGFRPSRNCADAMGRIWRILSSKKRVWILDADIVGCFNNIAHGPLLRQIEGFPAQALVARWLKAGYFKNDVFFNTDIGTPQGGGVSPLLANIALHGMEAALKVRYHSTQGYVISKYVPIRYADDFMVMCETEKDCLDAKEILVDWLGKRGMEFAIDKTSIRHAKDGFDFLGWNFRLFKNVKSKKSWQRAKNELVTLVRPSAKSTKNLQKKVGDLFRTYIGKEAQLLIWKLNPIIKGWSIYHRYVNSNETFRDIDNFLYAQTVRYARRKHPNKSWQWIKDRYFKDSVSYKVTKTGRKTQAKSSWTFSDKGSQLYLLRSMTLLNYASIKYGTNPLNPKDQDYFLKRKKTGLAGQTITKRDLSLHNSLATLQHGFCPVWAGYLKMIGLHVHHKVHRKDDLIIFPSSSS
jgi:RNA-directed DNA polymerase